MSNEEKLVTHKKKAREIMTKQTCYKCQQVRRTYWVTQEQIGLEIKQHEDRKCLKCQSPLKVVMAIEI